MIDPANSPQDAGDLTPPNAGADFPHLSSRDADGAGPRQFQPNPVALRDIALALEDLARRFPNSPRIARSFMASASHYRLQAKIYEAEQSAGAGPEVGRC